METMVPAHAAAERAHALVPVAASAASALPMPVSTVAKASPVTVKHAYGVIDPSWLGTWATQQSVFNRRLCSVPTSVLTQRGICHGTEVFQQMCDSDHANFITAGRNVA